MNNPIINRSEIAERIYRTVNNISNIYFKDLFVFCVYVPDMPENENSCSFIFKSDKKFYHQYHNSEGQPNNNWREMTFSLRLKPQVSVRGHTNATPWWAC